MNKKIIETLDRLNLEMLKQSEYYKPTIFWRDINKKFLLTFSKNGFKNFRRNKLANNFFVPLYHLRREQGYKKVIQLLNKKSV